MLFCPESNWIPRSLGFGDWTGVELVSEKVKAIQQWPPLRLFWALCGFLGLMGFYRRFNKVYAAIAVPLMNLFTQEKFRWPLEADLAFQTLKDAISKALVLTLPNFTIPFVVETDASGMGMGTILSQGGHPIAFFCKQFCPQTRSCVYLCLGTHHHHHGG